MKKMEKVNQTEQKLESYFEKEMILAFKNEEQRIEKYENVPWCGKSINKCREIEVPQAYLNLNKGHQPKIM